MSADNILFATNFKFICIILIFYMHTNNMEFISENNSDKNIFIDNVYVPLKRLNKIYSEKDDIAKVEIIDYYIKIAPYLLPHIKNKPFSMIHFPEGVGGKNFYQKQCPVNAPEWLETIKLESSSEKGYITWCLINDAASIIYMANRSVIEMHTWFSRLPDLKKPDVAVIDLDPSGNTGFGEAIVIARAFRFLLKQLNIYAVPKTSGSRGIHIYIPIKPLPFDEVQNFLNKLCGVVVATYPNLATTERIVKNRGDKIYLDAVQNASGKTIIAPYSLRVRVNLPVAAPLLWEELDNDNLKAADFNIKNIFARLEKNGDLMKNFYAKAQTLPEI